MSSTGTISSTSSVLSEGTSTMVTSRAVQVSLVIVPPPMNSAMLDSGPLGGGQADPLRGSGRELFETFE